MQRTELSLRDYGPSRGSHSHGYFQVLVGLRGVLELEVEGHAARIGAGHGIVIAPGDRHDFESRAGSRCLVLDTADAAWRRCDARPACPQEAAALATYLALACQRRGAAVPQGARLLLSAWQPSSARRARVRRPIDWAGLRDWAQAHLHEPLTVAELASCAHLSASQFNDRCIEANGMSAMAWLRLQRLERARSLRAEGFGVAETARLCGYRSPSALTAAIRRELR